MIFKDQKVSAPAAPVVNSVVKPSDRLNPKTVDLVRKLLVF